MTRFLLALLAWSAAPAVAQEPIAVMGDSVTIRLVDVDVRAAVQAMAPYVDRPITFGALGSHRVSFETPTPVPRSDVVRLLRGMLASQSLELFSDTTSGLYVVRERQRETAVSNQPGVRNGRPSQAGPEQTGDEPELFVIRLKHARAEDVASTVNALYGQATAFMELGASPSTLSNELRENRIPAGGSARAVQQAAGQRAAFEGEVVIVPDAATNSLLVRASASDFNLIEATVAQVDVRPLQVLIEVLIVEARKDERFAVGLEASIAGHQVDGATVSGTTTGLGLGDFVLDVMGIGSVDLNATLVAAEASGEVSIVSRPVVLATNNEWAEIVVGSQRPFVQVSRSLPTDTPSRDQVVQYKDVGTELNVRPTISDDGFVTLEVTQQVNAATSETAFDAPVISTRSVQTKLLVADGQTVVMGGLTDQQTDQTRSGVPFLNRLPLIGALFGSSTTRTVETELFVFLTPRLLRNETEMEEATREPLDRANRLSRGGNGWDLIRWR